MNSLLPVLTAAVILLIGWRVTWVALGIVIWLVVLPIARWGLVDRPADLGQHMDGPAAAAARAAGQSRAARVQTVSATLEEALRTPIFWVLTTATMTIGLISTGLMFHQIDVLGERGLSPLEGAVNFVPQMVAALSATLGIGAMIDGFRQRYILVGGMALLAVSMIGLLSVRPGLTAIAYGLVFGAAMGWMRAAENASYPKLFGVDHVGKIRGVAKGFTVAGTACGPFTLSLGHSVTGSYRMIVLALLVLPLAVITAALVLPDRPGTRDGRR